VTYSTGITYYYPYFYKTHLISFPDDTNNFFNQSDQPVGNITCPNNCEVCAVIESAKCLKCSSGYYLDEGKCVEYCPEGKLADILRAKCLSKDFSSNIDVVYTMAYSVGSCNNMCGKMVQDCSCAPSCKSKGNCCTNYDVVNCDFIVEKSSKVDQKKCKDAGCELCEETISNNNSGVISQKIVQSLNSTVLNNTIINSTLLNNSLINSTISNPNSTGATNGTSPIPTPPPMPIPTNTTSNIKCLQCSDDKFLFNGSCVTKCPEGFTANNINKVCTRDELSKNNFINFKNKIFPP
jgi:hypothetical protein